MPYQVVPAADFPHRRREQPSPNAFSRSHGLATFPNAGPSQSPTSPTGPPATHTEFVSFSPGI